MEPFCKALVLTSLWSLLKFSSESICICLCIGDFLLLFQSYLFLWIYLGYLYPLGLIIMGHICIEIYLFLLEISVFVFECEFQSISYWLYISLESEVTSPFSISNLIKLGHLSFWLIFLGHFQRTNSLIYSTHCSFSLYFIHFLLIFIISWHLLPLGLFLFLSF